MNQKEIREEKKNEIREKMLATIPEVDVELILEALFADPADPVDPAAIDDMMYELPGVGVKPYRKMTNSEKLMVDTFFREPTLMTIPARVMHASWFQDDLANRLGRYRANQFTAMRADPSTAPVIEIVVLAVALRKACGPEMLPGLMDELVFRQLRYKEFKDSVEPLIQEYVL